MQIGAFWKVACHFQSPSFYDSLSFFAFKGLEAVKRVILENKPFPALELCRFSFSWFGRLGGGFPDLHGWHVGLGNCWNAIYRVLIRNFMETDVFLVLAKTHLHTFMSDMYDFLRTGKLLEQLLQIRHEFRCLIGALI